MTVTADTFIRPSALEKLALCRGSAQLEAAVVNKFGHAAESPEARTGTTIHAYVSGAIQLWVDMQEVCGIDSEWGKCISTACNMAAAGALDPWSVRCVQLCCEFARDLITKHKIDPEHVLVEHHLDMQEFGFRRGGTADLVLVRPFQSVIIVDWKAGNLDQGDAEDHDQAQAYACAAAATFKVETVLVYLYQPRMERDRRASAAKFDAAALLANADWTRSITTSARDPHADITPSYSACKYCKALPACRPAKEMIVNALEAIQYIGNPNDPDAWGDLLASAKIGEQLHKAVIGTGDAPGVARAHLLAGGVATGFALQQSGPMTKVDAETAIAIAKERGFLDDLLKFASIKADAAKVLDIVEATSSVPKSPSIKAIKSKAA